jgi:hypothetical protein
MGTLESLGINNSVFKSPQEYEIYINESSGVVKSV